MLGFTEGERETGGVGGCGEERGRERERKKKENKKPLLQVLLTISHHCHVFFSLFGSASSQTYPNFSTSFHLGYYVLLFSHAPTATLEAFLR